MQEVVRRCDAKVGKSGNHCSERVPDDKSLTFSVRNVSYAADLCERHQNAFNEAISPFIEVAHPVSTKAGSSVRAALKGKKGGVFTTKDVRKWMQEQGRDVSPSGRLPNDVIEEYKAAHS